MDRNLEDIYNTLLEQNYASELFGNLTIGAESRRKIFAKCPFHDDNKFSFCYATDKPEWHCIKCGEGGDWLGYLEKRQNITPHSALEKLAKRVGIELKGYDRLKWERKRDQTNTLYFLWGYFIQRLWTVHGMIVLNYLKDRGYSSIDISKMELGFYKSQEDLEDYFIGKGYSLDAVNSFGLKVRDFSHTHKLIIPYRDPTGRLNGFIAKPIKSIEPNYILTFGDKKDFLFNIHGAKEQDDLIIVEDFLDALIITAQGVKGVVGLGRSSLTRSQVEVATCYGIKNFTLVFNNDNTVDKKIEDALDLLREKRVNAYVGKLPKRYTMLSELIKNEGIQAFKTLINDANSGVKGKTEKKLDRYDLKTDKGFTSRISTRTRVKGKKLIPIQVTKIIPTNAMDWGIKKIIDSPICLIRDAEEDSYYIADGNHRFYTKLLVQKIKSINAWVLEEGDQKRLHGNPLPTRLEDWKNGSINLQELCIMAKKAYEINEESINKDLELCFSGINNSDTVNNLDEVTNFSDFLHLCKE